MHLLQAQIGHQVLRELVLVLQLLILVKHQMLLVPLAPIAILDPSMLTCAGVMQAVQSL